LERLRKAGQPIPQELRDRIEQTRADYERWLDARYAAARGHCDAMIDPADSRAVLSFAFEVCQSSGHRRHLTLERL
jgi:acetyl-CoA carboxylase carboxyltransferase component